MESRLLLSGNQPTGDLDYSIWNLDSLQANYAIISQGDSLPSPSTSTSSAAGPSGAGLDVSWVAVPDMLLSPADAQKLAYQQYRWAMSQGVINFEQSSALYQQWLSGLSTDPGSSLVPVYTIGIRDLNLTPVVVDANHVLNVASMGAKSFSQDHVSTLDVNLNITPPIIDSVSSVGSPGSSLGINSNPIQNNITPISLDDDVRSTGDFNRDGFVDAKDYIVWRAFAVATPGAVSDSVTSAYQTWKSNFGRSVVDVTKVTGLLTGGTLGNDLAVNHDGILDPQPNITINVTQTTDLAATNNPLTTSFDFTLGGQNDFAIDTPQIIKLNPNSLSNDLQPASQDTLALEGLQVVIETVTFTNVELSPSSPILTIEVDAGSNQLIVSHIPAKIESTATSQSKAEQKLDQAIDELLAGDTILVVSDGQSGTLQVADATPGKAEVEQLAEGGMIAIDQIVATTSSEAAGANDASLVAAESTGLFGELSRVAVMELIEGEPEPSAPEAADHVVLLAANGATDDQAAASLATVKFAAARAGQAISLVSPLNPAYLASFAAAATDAFAAAINSELSGQLSDAARSAAFSEWDDDDANPSVADQEAPAAEHTANHWLSAAPLVVALACERVLAAKKKRTERESSRRSLKAK